MRTALLLLAVALLLPLSSVATDGAQTLNGEFQWNRMDNPGDLKAVFEPTGDSSWDVSFYFEFRGKPHTYTGTAEGSLTEGALRGKVFNENKKRTWTFEGAFEEGTFRGTHKEHRGEEIHDTGTLWLKA